MCSGLFSSSAKRARPARHASASGLPTSRRAVWSDWTMSGLSVLKGQHPPGFRTAAPTGDPGPLDPGDGEPPLVVPEPAPRHHARAVEDPRLDAAPGALANGRPVDDIDDEALVDRQLHELPDLSWLVQDTAVEEG